MINPTTADGAIYFFTLLGLWFIPHQLGKIRWVLIWWFLITNMFWFSGVFNLFTKNYPILPTLYSTLFLLISLYLFLKNIWSTEIILPQWGRWLVFRLMGVYFLFYLGSNDLPQRFVFNGGSYEILVGLAGWLLLAGQLESRLSQFGFTLWNVIGLYSACSLFYQFHLIYYFPQTTPSQYDIYKHFYHFPENWIWLFWIPLSVSIHLCLVIAIFGKKIRF